MAKVKRKIAYGRCFAALCILFLLCVGIPSAIRGWKIYRVYHEDFVQIEPDLEKFPIQGVDVSCYQGNIDWDVLAAQNIFFAFIKATEGSSFQDPNFSENWENVSHSGVYAGAYHFFSFESSGEVQAQNFISTVGERKKDTLPPVVDIELYGDYMTSPPEKETVRRELNAMLSALEKEYGVKPILYMPEKFYYSYIFGGGYGKYHLWIANARMEPTIRWSFWQYSHEGTLAGYDGMKDLQTIGTIDLNVYAGSEESFFKTFGLERKEQNGAIQTDRPL